MPSLPKLKLTYFNGIGRAEAIRLALHIGGIPFVDERLNREGFLQRKPSLVYGQLPVLEVDGQEMAQSQALLRYAGKLAGLYPVNDPLAALKVDEILAGLDEMQDKMMPSFFESDPDKKKAMRLELAQVTLPRYLALVEARLAKMQQLPMFQGDQIFIHDLHIYAHMRNLQSGNLDYIPTDLADGYALLKAAEAKVLAHPKVQQWNAAHSVAERKLKLTYFDMPGRAEPIRLAFFMGDIPFEDERIDRAELDKRRDSLPFGQVPVLEVNGEVISQSGQILRYAGSLGGLYPTNDPELALRVDEFLSLVDDIYTLLVPTYKMEMEERVKAREVLAETKLPALFGGMDKRIATWGGPNAVGATLTIADLLVYGVAVTFKRGMDGIAATLTDAFPNVTRIYEQVRNHEKVKDVAWLAQY